MNHEHLGRSDLALLWREAPPVLGAGMGTRETEAMARQAVLDGWQKVFPGDTPSLEEVQAIQAIGALEGQYGLGWKDHASPVTGLRTSMEGSNNWGAIQCLCKAQDGVCCEGCGYWYDSKPTAAGQQYFEQCFHRYATPADGAGAILKFLTNYKSVMAALPSGDLDEIAWQMRLGNYFMGFTTDKRKAAEAYAIGLDKRAAATAAALGEPRAAKRKGGALANPGGYAAAGWKQALLQVAEGAAIAAGVAGAAVIAWSLAE